MSDTPSLSEAEGKQTKYSLSNKLVAQCSEQSGLMNQATVKILGEENKPVDVVAAIHLAGGNKPDPTTSSPSTGEDCGKDGPGWARQGTARIKEEMQSGKVV